MKKIGTLFFAVSLLLFSSKIEAQVQTAQAPKPYAIVIKGGHVIDPKNNINEVMDIALNGDTIVRIAKNIDGKLGRQEVSAQGMYVTPGLIDIHSHNFIDPALFPYDKTAPNSLPPDGFTFRSGVTTVVDAGSSGWRNFPVFKKKIIDNSQTRVLAMINIVSEGIGIRAPINHEQNLNEMNSDSVAAVAKRFPKDVVGVKLAHFNRPDWTPVDRAVAAGNMANIPVMVDFGGSNPKLSIEELFFKHFRPGDIFTHCFAQLGSRESVVDVETKKVKPFVIEAQKRGIVFDVGHGGGSFWFSQAVPAFQANFYPNSISTDIHNVSMNGAMKDMSNIMSKFLAIGMDLPTVIKLSSWNPAQEIKRPELGHLSVGSGADLAIFTLRDGKFGFFDNGGVKIEGSKKLECEMTIRGGRIVYDLNGIAAPLIAPPAPRPVQRPAGQ